MSKTHVVVVGAGGYGALISKALSSKLDPTKHTLTLVSSREFYLHLPAALRLLVSPADDLESTALIPYDKLFPGVGTFKRGTVTEVKKNPDGKSGFVVLDSGEELPWNVLLLAPGNTWEGGLRMPETRQEAHTFIEEWRTKFEKANSIALVGGGAVGIELAGELRDIYPVSNLFNAL
jgi:apoptosis-inducing factor 2